MQKYHTSFAVSIISATISSPFNLVTYFNVTSIEKKKSKLESPRVILQGELNYETSKTSLSSQIISLKIGNYEHQAQSIDIS